MKGKNKSPEEDQKIEQIALREGLVDVCADENGKSTFLIYSGDSPTVQNEIMDGETKLVPPNADAMSWERPRAKEVVKHIQEDDDRKIIQEIEDILRQNVQLPGASLYMFCALWIVMTHLCAKMKYACVLILHSDAEHGKTRLGKLLTYLSRRGEVTETLNPANLFRKAHRFMGTIFFDVTDFWAKAIARGADDIFLGRFELGHMVARVLNPEKRGFDDTTHFQIYGPTIVATNEPMNHIFESRGVTINMEKSDKNFPELPSAKDLLPFKERLTALHYRWYDRELPQVEKPAKGRLGDILKPIYQIIMAMVPEHKDVFLDLVKTFEIANEDNRSFSPNAKIVEALIDCCRFGNQTVKVEDVVDKVNQGTHFRLITNPIAVGKRLAAMGFQKIREKNIRLITLDRNLIEKLARQYGLSSSEKSDQSGKSGK